MSTNKERLLGSRVKELIAKGVSHIPNNKLTRGLGTVAKHAELNLNRNPLTRLISQGEGFLANKGGQLTKHFGVEPFIGEMGVGFMIPGPGGEVKAGKQLLNTNKNLNKLTFRGSGSPFRARRPTKTLNPQSLIGGTPNKIIKAFPKLKDEAMEWARGAYDYARKNTIAGAKQPLEGYPRFVTPDGKLWRPKTNMSFGEGYSLKFVDVDLLKGYTDARALKEAPWRKQHVIDELQGILNKKSAGDELENLLKVMVSDYDKKLKSLPPGSTKGHYISLKKGGLDIAENFGEQAGKSHNKIIDGKKIKIDGNYAEQAQSSVRVNGNGNGDGSGFIPSDWEEYVEYKLPKLGSSLKKVNKDPLKELIIKRKKPASISSTKAVKIKK
tara:strand:+ start:205 stop:1353 length:1149 start_codon:yes stop_codon:yes gene_type:complete